MNMVAVPENDIFILSEAECDNILSNLKSLLLTTKKEELLSNYIISINSVFRVAIVNNVNFDERTIITLYEKSSDIMVINVQYSGKELRGHIFGTAEFTNDETGSEMYRYIREVKALIINLINGNKKDILDKTIRKGV